MNSPKTVEDARRLLDELRRILEKEGENNWIRGIVAARRCLDDPDIKRAVDGARSIYITMMGGNSSFSDYYIRRDNSAAQANANQQLDELRDELWRLFQIT